MYLGQHSKEPAGGVGNHGRPGSFRRASPLDERRPVVRYGFALLVTAVACGAAAFSPQLNQSRVYFFVGAIALASWLAGMFPGFVSLFLSCLLGWRIAFSSPAASSVPAVQIAYYGVFVAVCLLIYGLAVKLHQATRALRTSNLRFGGVVEISEDAIITIDPQQRITLFNPGAEAIFGYKSSEVLGKSLALLLPERFRAMHDRHISSFGNSKDALRAMNERGTIFGRRADGSEFPAEASISKFETAGEKILTVRLRDISERQAAEQRLRQMAAIVESSQDSIISEDLEGVITSWNPAAEHMYGYSPSEAIGRDARMLLPPGAPDEVSTNVAKVREGLSSTVETVRMCKDGKPIDVALTVSPIRDRNGNIAGLATIVRDITERKRLEQQFLHSQKMEAVGRLAGGVAHDFNNLLSIIVGYTYLIQSSTAEGEPLRNAADEIMSASDKAAGLTRQLLAFSRKQVMRPEVLDLNEVTAGISKILPRLLGEDIDVQCISGEELHHVKADPGQIEQVIMNLVVNARDAMPNGGKLTLETANIDFDQDEARQRGLQAGPFVMLAVSDTGLGMSAETRARIFEPFFTTKEAGKGTGLGLATVYGIVSQSNGHIWVYSEPGHGTTFKIYLPATTAAAARRPAAPKPEPSLCGKETLLLVEDESQLRDLIQHVLHDRGYRVLVAGDGPEALQLAAQHKGTLDLLLTDVVMPTMRGQVLAKKLLQRYPTMAVLYMSGYTDNSLVHNGSLPPGTCFMEKPFTPDTLLQRVREVLDETAEGGRAQRRAI